MSILSVCLSVVVSVCGGPGNALEFLALPPYPMRTLVHEAQVPALSMVHPPSSCKWISQCPFIMISFVRGVRAVCAIVLASILVSWIIISVLNWSQYWGLF